MDTDTWPLPPKRRMPFTPSACMKAIQVVSFWARCPALMPTTAGVVAEPAVLGEVLSVITVVVCTVAPFTLRGMTQT